MAEAAVKNDPLCCSICLDLMKDPVAIPCGHSYCMGCIKGYWSRTQKKKVYSCPHCMQIFPSRPALNKNTVLAEVVEKVRTKGRQLVPPADSWAKPGDVECDCCTGRKLKAVQSCLVCLASYCQAHIQPHYKSPAFKTHKLVKAMQNFEENICKHHRKLLEVFCRFDRQCICCLCAMDEHRGHATISAAAEIKDRKTQLRGIQAEVHRRAEEREREVETVRNAVEAYKCSAQTAAEEAARVFSELTNFIERTRSELKKMIASQKKAAVVEAEGVLQELQTEISQLRDQDVKLKQLLLAEDKIGFIQSSQSFLDSSKSANIPRTILNPHPPFRDVMKAISELNVSMRHLCKQHAVKISAEVSKSEVFLSLSQEMDFQPICCHPRCCRPSLSLIKT
ncbi:E3 ubiquitin/ISG15 ligase TRIM25-like [Denticeps clupeoides]|uniref:Uncharacterized protein n=1 Tax=Denticeps clupeoides TaxID=299321 RepID=A0AAY4B7G0_9TELE|nr:E3 ubiquitin/ISG15 ligase TRIM25-like [Denticeps clupeoides]